MTRISIGVYPYELPDQMLVNESEREVPRLFNMPPCKHVPDAPTLGTGHVSYYRAHLGTVVYWRMLLRAEMARRGMTWKMPIGPVVPGEADIAHYEKCHKIMRDSMLQRVTERIAAMKRTPTWAGQSL